jgi:hypothetical protein
LLISSKAFGKLCSGAKTLGWEHSNGSLKMISKTLEWSAIPLMDFKNEFENKVGMFSLFQHHLNLFETTLLMKTNIDQRSKYTLMQRYKKI